MSQFREYLKLHHRHWHWKKAGVVFVHVPKAAGTSVSTALYGRFLGHYTADQINEFNSGILKKLPSFSAVRNPWDRCLSAFRFSKRPELGDGVTPSLKREVREELAEFETFDSFIFDWLKGKDVNELDYVFQEQSHFLCDAQENKLVDFVGKLDAMNEVENWLGETLDKKIQIAKLNISGDAVKYREWYSKEARDLVENIYKRDIENFEFEF